MDYIFRGDNKSCKAVYTPQKILEYVGNPFIEALPQIDTKEEVIKKIATYPIYKEGERFLDDNIRVHIISQRLFNVFQPLPQHLELESRISTMIRSGYISRNPLNKKYTESFINGYNEFKLGVKSDFNGYNTANSMSIIGVSGMGKSSSVNRILSNIPQVIEHSQYNGIRLTLYQLVWLKLDCPYDGSIKGLCIDFFCKVDEILGTSYFNKYGTSKRTVDTMLSVLGQVSRNCGLGLLVVDEIQHLNQAKSGGVDKMLNFFTTLVNVVGIPILLIGTMKAKKLLQVDFRMARRTLGTGGNIVWERLKNDESWQLLMDTIWNYQYTKKESKLSKEILDMIYNESQGIIDVAVKIYAMSQIRAISTGKEEITVDIIKNVVDKDLKAVKPMIDALKSNDIRRIVQYEDICQLDYENILKQNTIDMNLNNKIKEYKKEIKKHNISKKEQALYKMLELGISKEKSISIIEKILNEEESITVNELVIRSIKEIDNISSRSRKSDIIYEKDDIRFIVNEYGNDLRKIYDRLKEKEYIKDISFIKEETI